MPTVGGIAEVILEGATSYSVDSRDAERLSARLSELLVDEERYQRFSAAAKARVARFRETAFKVQSLAILAGQPEMARPENGLISIKWTKGDKCLGSKNLIISYLNFRNGFGTVNDKNKHEQR